MTMPLITGPVEGATIGAPSGRVYDLTSGLILIEDDDVEFVVNEYYRLYAWAAANDPGSFCEAADRERHGAHPLIDTSTHETVGWVCPQCGEHLTKNGNGFWTLKSGLCPQ